MTWEKDLSEELIENSRPWETRFVLHVASTTEKTETVKLTEAQREEIRRDYVRGSRTHGQPALARKHGVSQPTIHNVLKEKK